MSDKIKAALLALDVTNDNHWTNDGAPRIDSLKIAVGNPSLTREDVNAAVPGFSRATAGNFAETGTSGVAPAPTPTPGEAPVTATSAAQAAPMAEELPNLGGEPLAEPAPSVRQVMALPDVTGMNLEEANEFLSQLMDVRSQVQQAIPEVQNQIARLEHEHKVATGTDNHNPIQAYLANQVKIGEERAALRLTVEESGVNLRELSERLGASPIDQALASRKRQTRQLK
jgi:hypothetical protein